MTRDDLTKGYVMKLAAEIRKACLMNNVSEERKFPEVSLNELMEGMRTTDSKKDFEKACEDIERREKVNNCKNFLKQYTPLKLEEKLNAYVIGQPELVKAVADFLYYHTLRQVYPRLPIRNLLIAGSSGSGKTEVFRRVKELFGHILYFFLVMLMIYVEKYMGQMNMIWFLMIPCLNLPKSEPKNLIRIIVMQQIPLQMLVKI